jgi:hypothetical protein
VALKIIRELIYTVTMRLLDTGEQIAYDVLAYNDPLLNSGLVDLLATQVQSYSIWKVIMEFDLMLLTMD